MYIIVNLIDTTFDLIGSVRHISFENNCLEIKTNLNTGYSYNLDSCQQLLKPTNSIDFLTGSHELISSL